MRSTGESSSPVLSHSNAEKHTSFLRYLLRNSSIQRLCATRNSHPLSRVCVLSDRAGGDLCGSVTGSSLPASPCTWQACFPRISALHHSCLHDPLRTSSHVRSHLCSRNALLSLIS